MKNLCTFQSQPNFVPHIVFLSLILSHTRNLFGTIQGMSHFVQNYMLKDSDSSKDVIG